LAVSDDVWNLAVRRAAVIGPLADTGAVGLAAADAAAVELGVSRRQVYLMLRRWRDGEGVVSDLIPGRSNGGRGRGHLPDEVETVIRELLRTRYLTRQKRSMAVVHRELARICRSRGWRVPSRGTLARRVAMLDPVKQVAARQGSDAARALRAAGGTPPAVTGLLGQVQMDHTEVDLVVVDERHRLPIGRPYLTIGIDVCSRCIVGLVVTLEAPSALSVGLYPRWTRLPWITPRSHPTAPPLSGSPHAKSRSSCGCWLRLLPAGSLSGFASPDPESVSQGVCEVGELDRSVVDERDDYGRAELLGSVDRSTYLLDLDVEDRPVPRAHFRGVPQAAAVLVDHAVSSWHRRLTDVPGEERAVKRLGSLGIR
jgi:hypothetical protein